MSKPDINCLGITSELTLHERALRNAQNEITVLRAENARLREELRVERANRRIPSTDNDRRILCDCSEGARRGSIGAAIIEEHRTIAKSMQQIPVLQPTPPHHSTVGVGIDGEGRVQG